MTTRFHLIEFDIIRFTNETPRSSPYEVAFEDSRGHLHKVMVSDSREPVQLEVKLSNSIHFKSFRHTMPLYKLNGEEHCRLTFRYYPLDEWRIEGIRVNVERLVVG